jgi:hypothetical protein
LHGGIALFGVIVFLDGEQLVDGVRALAMVTVNYLAAEKTD